MKNFEMLTIDCCQWTLQNKFLTTFLLSTQYFFI